MLVNYGVVWFEEALPHDDIKGFRELRRSARLFISCGEVLTRRQSFRPWLETSAVDIIQPDVTKAGAISLRSHDIVDRNKPVTVWGRWADLHSGLPSGSPLTN